MFPSSIWKDIWNTFWPALAFWVIINLNETGFKNNGKNIFHFPIIVLTYIDVVFSVKEYHVYKNVWTPRLQEQVHREIEPKSSVDKYVVTVKKDAKIVGHLSLRKSGKCKNDFLFPSSWSVQKVRYNSDWQGSKYRRWWWNAGTLRSTFIRPKAHGGDIKTADQKFLRKQKYL